MPAVIISMSPDGQFRVATTQADEAILATGKTFSDIQAAMGAAASMLAGSAGGSDMAAAGSQDAPDDAQSDPDDAMAQGFASARGPRRMMDDGAGMR